MHKYLKIFWTFMLQDCY